MIMKKCIQFVILSFLLVGCKEKNALFIDTFLIEEKVKAQDVGSKMVSEVSFTPLNDTLKMPIGDVTKLLVSGDKYFILDSKMTQSLSGFNFNGEPIKTYNHLGSGPDEYIQIGDFDIDAKSKHIAMFCFPPKIVVLDSMFQMIRVVPIKEKYFDRIAIMDENVLLYSKNDGIVKRYSLLKNEFYDCLKIDALAGYVLSTKDRCFYRDGQDLYFYTPGNDAIYKYADSKFEKVFGLKYKGLEILSKVYDKTTEAVKVDAVVDYQIPSIVAMSSFNNQFTFVYTYNFMYRKFTYDLRCRKQTDEILSFISELGTSFFYDKCLYVCGFPARFFDTQSQAYQQFFKGVVHQSTVISNSEEHPVVVRYKLK